MKTCKLPGCPVEDDLNKAGYCCSAHCSYHAEMQHPKSERVLRIEGALKSSGCPVEVLEEAVGERLAGLGYNPIPTKVKFIHPTRPTQYLIKVTARAGDDLWILSNLELPAICGPTTRKKALRYLTPENGWTKVEEPCEWS